MKKELDDKNRKALVKYRMERAFQTIKEAELLRSGNFYNASINRLYYACFYATEALLLANKITARTHSGVKSMLGLHFVSKRLLSLEAGQTFVDLFELRHDGDYDDFVFCDANKVDEYLPKAKSFIDEVEKLLHTQNS